MISFDPHVYGPIFAPLLVVDRRRGLDAGPSGASVAASASGTQAAFDALTLETAFAHARVVDRDMAACCIAGVWLLYDCLDESHSISQGIETPSGSFWHAIMHRREGDFWNSKYWFRRVGKHPIFESIGERASELAAARGGNPRLGETRPREWDPLAFVDLCEAVVNGESDAEELCRDVQQAEWESLFDHCYRAAVTGN